jgi:hypothetical protein
MRVRLVAIKAQLPELLLARIQILTIRPTPYWEFLILIDGLAES